MGRLGVVRYGWGGGSKIWVGWGLYAMGVIILIESSLVIHCMCNVPCVLIHTRWSSTFSPDLLDWEVHAQPT